jgi:hypothetical protein
MPAKAKSKPLRIILEQIVHLAGRTLALPVISAYVWFVQVYYELPVSKVKAESPGKTTIGKNPTQKYVVLLSKSRAVPNQSIESAPTCDRIGYVITTATKSGRIGEIAPPARKPRRRLHRTIRRRSWP